MSSEKNIRDREDGSGGGENKELNTNGSGANEDKKYTFIQEKIVPKKRKKLKRFFMAFFCTVFLACIFGIVARAAFVCSEPWVEKLLGKAKEDGKQPVVLPAGDATSESGIDNSSGTGQQGSEPADEQNPGNKPGSSDMTQADGTDIPDGSSQGGDEDASQNCSQNDTEPSPGEGGSGETNEGEVSGGETAGELGQTGVITGTPLPGDGTGIGLPVTEPSDGTEAEGLEQNPIIVEQRIEADISDYIGIYTDIKRLASRVKTSILNVTAVTSGVDWFNDPYEARKTTTGIVIADNGTDLLLLASLDKIQDANLIEVEINASLFVEARVLDYDSDVNLAIVAVPLAKIPEANQKLINKADLGESYTITTGSPVMALGSPNGHVGSIELGIITSKGSSVYIVDNKLELFNTSITDNENSDGVIVDMQGQIIGIITHTLKEGLNENISTAIGISKIMPIVQRLANKKDRIYFGIHGEDIPANILEQAGIENGIYVNEVEAGSPALEAGIKSGDMIVEVGGKPVSSMTTFYNTISNYNVKESIAVKVRRQSQGSFKDVIVNVVLTKKNR